MSNALAVRFRSVLCAAALAAVGAACLPAAAQAEFGLQDFDVGLTQENGAPATEAGTHPFAFTTDFDVNTKIESGIEFPEDAIEDLRIDFPPGLVGTPNPVEPCSNADFLDIDTGKVLPTCPDGSAVGVVTIRIGISGGPTEYDYPVYNLDPAPGVAAKLGFIVLGGIPVTVDVGVAEGYPNNLVANVTNISQAASFYGSELTAWGVPADPAHDAFRGSCLDTLDSTPNELVSKGDCPADVAAKPYLTLPRACEGPLSADFEAISWQNPGETPDRSSVRASAGTTECPLRFEPATSAQPTTRSAGSATGLDFDLEIDDQGLTSPEGRAHSDIKKAEVTLPEGMTINPSQAEGLGVCGEADFSRESAESDFGEGCPGDSKIGTVEVETPLLPGETLEGQLFVAEPYENPFDSLIALYMTIKSPKLGIYIGLPGEVVPDEETGQLVTTFGGEGTDPLPQLPFSDFRLRFREGGRSPLITPNECGTYETEAVFTPWADSGSTDTDTSSFEITSGVGGGPCPSGDTPPFGPGFQAGTLNNAAGQHSPFAMRLTRRDGDQDITRFDATLPPGVLAKLAGVSKCPESAIAQADANSGEQELAHPACPDNSKIGSVLTAAGVGSDLTYVPGSVYLADSYKGAPLSVVAVVPAVAGPFDVGTVVVRQALTLNPITSDVEVDSDSSDPIPHILEGIPLRVRDIRVDVDRDEFTLNPTSCAPAATTASIWGGGDDVFSEADDSAVSRAARFQAAGCASLGFSPRLGIRLFGGVRRGAFPALRAVVTPPPGQANFSRAAVILPNSAFIEQGHFGNICTRVQFAAGAGHGSQCPPRARYGFARAWTPLLDGVVQGPVFLRSSDNELPDLVVALRGPPSARVDVELSAKIDSVGQGLRATFAGIPDVPVSRFILAMQGGKKGLIVNSRHLCFKPGRNKATGNLRGQNGRLHRIKPRVVSVTCAKRRKARRRKAKRAAALRSARVSVLGGRAAR